MADRLKDWAPIIKRDVHALYLASRDPRVPWYAKAMAVLVAGYALSPIDLIPDFIPVLGYLDDVILVPLGILLVIRLIPPAIMAEHRDLAAVAHERPVSRVAALVIACIWIASIALCGWLLYRYSFVSSNLAKWLEEAGMEHVRGAPCHRQTQGKFERWHQTLKNRILAVMRRRADNPIAIFCMVGGSNVCLVESSGGGRLHAAAAEIVRK